jgi:hypothetical protein
MENLDEQIKDPNQLDMFAGILLTPEQDKMIASFIANQKALIIKFKEANTRDEKLLIDNGFIRDIHFINTFKVEPATKEVSLGSSYSGNAFKTELTFEVVVGSILLKGKQFYDNELKDSTFIVEFNKGKVQSSTIQGQYRFIKPATLLEKLETYSKRSEYQFEEYQKKTNLKQNVIEKYTKLYPNATIEVKKEWTKYSGDFEVIKVQFTSGSYVQFRLDTYKNIEYLYKKYDAEVDKMNSDELLERFSKQEALK